MSSTVPFLPFRAGLLLLTTVSLSFSAPHTFTDGGGAVATVCLPVEAALRRDLQEAQRRFVMLRAKNFKLRQQLMQSEELREIFLIQSHATYGSMNVPFRYSYLNGVMRELQEEELHNFQTRLPIQIPLQEEEFIK